jgi:hypothetical protein
MVLTCECCEEAIRPRDLVHIVDLHVVPLGLDVQVLCDPCWNEADNGDGYCTRPGTIGYNKANRPVQE